MRKPHTSPCDTRYPPRNHRDAREKLKMPNSKSMNNYIVPSHSTACQPGIPKLKRRGVRLGIVLTGDTLGRKLSMAPKTTNHHNNNNNNNNNNNKKKKTTAAAAATATATATTTTTTTGTKHQQHQQAPAAPAAVLQPQQRQGPR